METQQTETVGKETDCMGRWKGNRLREWKQNRQMWAGRKKTEGMGTETD